MGAFLTFLLYAGATILLELIKPKPKIENEKPAGLGDFRFPTATEDRPIPHIWGTAKLEGPNVVWWGDYRQEPITIEQKVNLFQSKEQVVGFRYFLGIQYAFCRGARSTAASEQVEMLRLWIGPDEVDIGAVPIVHGDTFTIDEPDLFGGEDHGYGGVQGTLKFFAGRADQTASSYLAPFQDISGKTPAYSGTCYFAPDLEAIYIGNSATSIAPWAAELRRLPNGLNLTTPEAELNGGYDANPANVLFELMTDPDFLGFDESTIDTSSGPRGFKGVGSQLALENNGFSFVLDRQESIEDMIRRLQEQIDGVVYFNEAEGLWQIALIRDDYDPDTIDEISQDAGLIEIASWSRGLWDGTTNQVRIPFNQRDDEYKDTGAGAKDMANVRIQGGRVVSASQSHPGVKDAALANSLATRELRTLAYPLAGGELVLDRRWSDLLPGDVRAFTDPDIGVERMPVRIQRIDTGELTDGRVRVQVVQDVFRSAAGGFGNNPASGWTPPEDNLGAFPADEQEAFEAPRALTWRAPLSSGPDLDKVFAFARKQGVETSFEIRTRDAIGTPAGTFTAIGEVWGFALAGELFASLGVGSAYPLASLIITATPDTQPILLAALPTAGGALDPEEIGTELSTLLLVDGEFMLCRSAQASGPNVQLNNVYRGVLDSPQQAHSSGATVWLVFMGAGISDDTITPGHNVDTKLIPRSRYGEVLEAAATTIAFQMQDRVRRPYPPSEFDLNGTRFPASTSLEGTGSGEGIGIGIELARRDFRVAEGGNEVAQLGVDAGTLFADFPAAHSTEHEADIRDDPGGTNTFLLTFDIGGSATATIPRLEILLATGGSVPSTLRIAVRARHTYLGDSYDSLSDLVWDFTVTSALAGLFEFGALDTNVDSASFVVVDDSQDHDFTLSSAFTAGAVEYRINGGSWTSVIAAGLTTGTVTAALLNNGDTLEVRHTSSDTGALKLLTMDVGGPLEAFAVLYV